MNQEIFKQKLSETSNCYLESNLLSGYPDNTDMCFSSRVYSSITLQVQ